MHNANQTQGKLGERLAAHFLKTKGFTIVAQNFFARIGEIDIVAEKDECRIFVEVKMRTSQDFGEPYEQVTQSKIQKIVKTASMYNQKFPIGDKLYRIDVISIYADDQKKTARIKWFTNITN